MAEESLDKTIDLSHLMSNINSTLEKKDLDQKPKFDLGLGEFLMRQRLMKW